MKTVKINGRELDEKKVYDLACELCESIHTDDGKELCNPTPTKEILETTHVPLRERLLRVLRQGDPNKNRIIEAMSAPPNLDEEADFEDPAGDFEKQTGQPYQVVNIEPEFQQAEQETPEYGPAPTARRAPAEEKRQPAEQPAEKPVEQPAE